MHVRRFDRHDHSDEPYPEPQREEEEAGIPDLRRRCEEPQERQGSEHGREQRPIRRPGQVLVGVAVEESEGVLELRSEESRGAPFRPHVAEPERVVPEENGRLHRANGELLGKAHENEEKRRDGKEGRQRRYREAAGRSCARIPRAL